MSLNDARRLLAQKRGTDTIDVRASLVTSCDEIKLLESQVLSNQKEKDANDSERDPNRAIVRCLRALLSYQDDFNRVAKRLHVQAQRPVARRGAAERQAEGDVSHLLRSLVLSMWYGVGPHISRARDFDNC